MMAEKDGQNDFETRSFIPAAGELLFVDAQQNNLAGATWTETISEAWIEFIKLIRPW
jgi:hypothetical protein